MPFSVSIDDVWLMTQDCLLDTCTFRLPAAHPILFAMVALVLELAQ